MRIFSKIILVISQVSCHCYAQPLAIVAITEQLVIYIPGEIVVVRWQGHNLGVHIQKHWVGKQ
jgi:hypothetical protein